MTDFYIKINGADVTSDVAIIVFCVALLAIFVVGIVQRIRKVGVKAVVEDEVVIKIKGILIDEIADILKDMGLTEDYESFKNQVLLEALKRVRAYIDKKGGLLDTITDEIDDDTILEIINEALQLSDLESKVGEAYDNLIHNRISEMEATEDEAASKVDDDGYYIDNAEDSDVDVLAEPEKIETDKE